VVLSSVFAVLVLVRSLDVVYLSFSPSCSHARTRAFLAFVALFLSFLSLYCCTVKTPARVRLDEHDVDMFDDEAYSDQELGGGLIDEVELDHDAGSPPPATAGRTRSAEGRACGHAPGYESQHAVIEDAHTLEDLVLRLLCHEAVDDTSPGCGERKQRRGKQRRQRQETSWSGKRRSGR
jgi:hypothetical protein